MKNKILKRIGVSVLTAAVMCTGFAMPEAKAAGSNCGGLEEVDIYTPEEGDVIPDPLLHWAVRVTMNAISAKIKLTEKDVREHAKYISFEQSNHPENFVDWKKPWRVESLEGLQYATNAVQVDVGYAAIKHDGVRINDLSPIAGLTQLEQLLLTNDGLDDISAIKNLTNLSDLVLNENDIEDISVISGMTKMKNMNLSMNKISDVSAITGMTKLKTLNLSENEISQLPDLSNLKNLTELRISGNKLTDVSALATVRTLQVLDLSKNPELKDVKPLAVLTNLEKSMTFINDTKMKEDLFAAIEVNKSMEDYSISFMTKDDLKAVQKTLDLYEALSEDQKEYIDTEKIQAILSNKEKVDNGEKPQEYAQYDEIKAPVLNKLQIRVVNKYGDPAAGVQFEKQQIFSFAGANQSYSIVTDKNGMLEVSHTAFDAQANDIVIKPNQEGVSATPEEIHYTVNFIRETETLNGKKATGLEELKFVISDEKWDAAEKELQSALEKAKDVKDYNYTAESYSTFDKSLKQAKALWEEKPSDAKALSDAAAELTNAMNSLKKSDVPTTLKIKVQDQNGNPVARNFKFQVVKYPDVDSVGWNEWTDGETSIGYIKATAGWQKGQQWQIRSCYDETYEMTPIVVTTEEKDGVWYFESIDGKPAVMDYETTVTVVPRPNGAINKEGEIKPDATLLSRKLDEVSEIASDPYTGKSYKKLQDAIHNAQQCIENEKVTQDDINLALAQLKAAESSLLEKGAKNELQEVFDEADGLDEAEYDAESWKAVAAALKEAKDALSSETVDQTAFETAKTALEDAMNRLKKVEKLTDVNVSLATESYTYDGKVKTPAIVAKDSKGAAVPASAYTVEYAAGRKVVGEYHVKVTFKEAYAGTVTKTFTVYPKGTKLTSVKAGKKSVAVKIAKQTTQTSGYQLQYAADKKFARGAKIATISKNKTVKKTLKKLKSRKTYYVRVRTFKTVKINGKNVKLYSDWSAAKKAKVK